MSRAPPFPAQSSSRRPPNEYYYSSSSTSTQPLSINRPPSRSSRPETPSSQASTPPLRASGSVPARPARSDLRARLNSSTSVPVVSRHGPSDSYSGSQYQQHDDDVYQVDEEPETPRALTAAVAAFQSAGQQGRKRGMTNGTNGTADSRSREPPKRDRREEKEREKDRMARANGRARDYSNLNDLDSVLERIKDEWSFVAEEDFNPVEVALSLLDTSSVGRDLDSFRRTKYALERALKAAVDKNYQSFAASLPHHAALLSSLTSTQSHITDARSRLVEVREALGNKRADLVQLWSRGHALDEMLALLDEIETLKSIPDALESLMTEKRLLQASVLLVKNLKTINKQDMLEVGAVSDLRSYLTSQETALRDILIEELHHHLFLKTFWSDSRWAPYTPGQDSLPTLDSDMTPRASAQPLLALSPTSANGLPSRPPTKLSGFLEDLTLRPTVDPLLDISSPLATSPLATSFDPSGSFPTIGAPPSSQNPESDSFTYMETVLESLAVLGQLGYGLDVVAQRLPAEIHLLIESTLDEVTERQETNRRASVFVPSGRPSSVYVFSNPAAELAGGGGLRLAALESSEKEVDREILRDLFWTLYSKLDAVLQGMRVVYEVTNRISARREFKDNSGARPGNLFPLGDLYQPVLTEVKTLLRDNLTDEDRGSSSVNPIASINEALRNGKTIRDRNKQTFRFTESDSKSSSRVLKRHEDELTRVLKETVPGLVQGPSDNITPLSRMVTDDRFAGAEKHRLLIPPSAFHVSVLFKPTQAFLERMGETLPPVVYDAFKDENALLDDFVLNVYLPQLEEKVSALVHHSISGPDAFEEDPSSLRISPRPLVKACMQLMALINSLCAMLRTTPFHRENYSRLILSVIIHFYQRCNTRFQSLVAKSSTGVVPDVLPDAMLHVAARWAQKAEVTACLTELYSTPDADIVKKESVCQQETRIELSFLNNDSIAKEDLVPLRNLADLFRLHHSLTWFINHLAALRVLTEDPISPQSADPLAQYFSPAKPSFEPRQDASNSGIVLDNQLQMPLTRAMALRFDALLKTYDLLAEVILSTARIDVRCRTIYHLNQAMRTGDFQIEHEPFEPDPQIIELNSEMGKVDDSAAITLPERERRFIFEGLGSLMDQLLVTGARYVNLANVHGVEKVMRNLLALEQNLKTMTGDETRDADLSRARKYWNLFVKGPRIMLDDIHKNRPTFTFDEYKAMLSLQCGVDQTAPAGGGGAHLSELNSARSSMTENADRRAYNEYLIDLHALAVEDW